MRRTITHPKLQSFKQVFPFLSQFSFSTSKQQSFSTSVVPSANPSLSTLFSQANTHKYLSSVNLTGISESVISKSSHLWDDNDKDGTFTDLGDSSFQDYVLRLSSISPESIHRFWRVNVLTPHVVLDILLGFERDCGRGEVGLKKVESLWGIFTLAEHEGRGFEHLSQSCRIMGGMLVNVGMFSEAEILLSKLDEGGVLLGYDGILSDLIEGYVGRFQLKRAIYWHDRMKLLGRVPSLSCYQALLNYVVQLGETQLGYDLYLNMIDAGLVGTENDIDIFVKVVRLLCRDERVQEARNLVKKIGACGISPHSLVLKAMVDEYCKKKDYEEILSLFIELHCTPETRLGNKILYSMGEHYGLERAESLMYQLLRMGFNPDEKTYGTLIGWCCHEGKLKKAMLYLSEILSQGFTPDKHSYDAIIGGLFEMDLWQHVDYIVDEMKDRGVVLGSSTFRVLLAGYLKARKFKRVKKVIGEMADHNLIQLSLSEDPLCKGLIILGLTPDVMKIKSDNDKKFHMTEFFDNLRNRLYSNTDLDECDKYMAKVLSGSMFPDVNSLVLSSFGDGEMQHAVTIVHEMARWGQQPSLSCFSALLKGLCASPCSMETLVSLLEEMFELTYNLEEEALNKLVQTFCEKGFTSKARIIFEGMLMRRLNIENETYTLLLKGFCNKQDLVCFRDCWKLARKHNWTPKLEDVRATFGCLCQLNLVKEALELFESMSAVYPRNFSDVLKAFLEIFCGGGLTFMAHVLVEELLQQGCYPDYMAYKYLVKGFCKDKMFAEATSILDTILSKNIAFSTFVVMQLIPQLCMSGNFEKAVALKDVCLEKLPSTRAVYRALLSGFCKCNKIDKAANLLQEMLIEGCIPDIEEYSLLIEGYCRGNNFEKALELIGLLMRKNSTLPISCYRNLVRLMCVNGRHKVAWGLKDLTIVENGIPNLVRYNILIYHLFSTRRTDLVHILLDELHKKGVEFDEVTFNFIIHGFSLYKDASKSLHYLTSMIAKDFRPSNRCLRGVIRCFISVGKLAEALKLSVEMESRGWSHGVVVQSVIVDSLLCQGKRQEAVDFLNRMVSKGLTPENVNYEFIIKRLCKYGVLEKAMDLYYLMLKKNKQLDSLSFDCMIENFSNGNKLDIAMDLHSEMLFRKLKPNISTWSTLVQRLSEIGRTEEAEKLIDLMVLEGETPTREMYSSLVNKYRSENNHSKASKLVQAMQQNGYEPDFETHWSIISKIGDSKNNIRGGNRRSIRDSKDDGGGGNRGFLSSLLSQGGLSSKNAKPKNG